MNLLVYYANINVKSPDECWTWRGVLSNGRGVHSRKICGTYSAHRIMNAIFNSDLISGLEIDHLCQNPACVNPLHLEQVTKQENNRRRRTSHCKRGHPFSEENTIIRLHPKGRSPQRRGCMECLRHLKHEWYLTHTKVWRAAAR